LPDEGEATVAPYRLHTPVYGDDAHAGGSFAVELAVPLALLAGKPAQLWNILVGELPRLGFITRFRLVEATLPDNFGPGPGFGVAGLRKLTAQPAGPLLCRSMRPAVGLNIETMARLNRDVLIGGFHIVKDDELQVFPDQTLFERHVRAMLEVRDAAIAQTGEKKLYFANLICEPWELTERWETCCRLGVDGVLIAPWIQGLGTLVHLARQRRMPLLAHNTLGELFTRHPDWKVDERVTQHWLQALGADLFVTSGDFGDAPETRLDAVCVGGDTRTSPLSILQGGKNPDDLPRYRQAVGSDDFMLIVASWVDHHPEGLIEAARQFREALTQPTA
jgi:ribulose 1,5-bisphosphate carboxylase large subunit-like protein